MFRFLVERSVQLLLVLLLVATGAFALVRLIPGDPIKAKLGIKFDPEVYQAQRRELGLDRPIHEQYANFLIDSFIRGEYGRSFVSDRPVAEELRDKFPATIELTLAAMFLAIWIGVAAGIVSAVWKNTVVDHASMMGALVGVSVPVYFLGLILIIALGDRLPYAHRLDPTVRFEGVTGFLLLDTLLAGRFDLFREAFRHLILPATALSTIPMAITARMTRSAMLDCLGEDYIRTARAKGVLPWRVVIVHALRNASLPTVTVIGLSFGYLLAGAILTETIFSWPGMGEITPAFRLGSCFSVLSLSSSTWRSTSSTPFSILAFATRRARECSDARVVGGGCGAIGRRYGRFSVAWHHCRGSLGSPPASWHGPWFASRLVCVDSCVPGPRCWD